MSLKFDATIKNLINVDKIARASAEFKDRSFAVGYLENSMRRTNTRLDNGRLMHWLHNGTVKMPARPLFQVIEEEYSNVINNHLKDSYSWFVDSSLKRKNSDAEKLAQKASLTFLTQLKNTMLIHWEDENVQNKLEPLQKDYQMWKSEKLNIPFAQVKKLLLFKELKGNLTFTSFKAR